MAWTAASSDTFDCLCNALHCQIQSGPLSAFSTLECDWLYVDYGSQSNFTRTVAHLQALHPAIMISSIGECSAVRRFVRKDFGWARPGPTPV